MSENQNINEVSVDRRAETVTTQQAGYAATEQVTRDVAAERRLGVFQINRIMWTVLGILEILLGLRFMLKLIAANAESGFATFIYGITGAFTAPFNALLGTPAYLAPEQVEGRPVGAAADRYAFAALLFELLTGQPPFQSETPLGVLVQQASGEPPRVSQRRPDLPAAHEADFDTEWLDAVLNVAVVDGVEGALQLPTFLGNHDMGRIGHFIAKANPGASPEELLARTRLAHSMLLLLRGVPTIYYGDEQGMTGDGGDQDAREPLFPSQVASYNDNRLIGTDATPADANFDTGHPVYAHVRALAALRTATPALRRGTQTILGWQETPGLFALARSFEGETVLIAFNSSATPLDARVAVDPSIGALEALHGSCRAPDAPGSWRVQLPAFGTLVCRVR